MPNHVTNKIVIHSSNFSEVIAAMKSTKEAGLDFDFNCLIPMPESLDIESSSTTEAAFVYHITNGFNDDLSAPYKTRKYFGSVFNEFSSWASVLETAQNVFSRLNDPTHIEDFKKLGVLVNSNYNKYGCSTWYQWCPKNWGTKWNAYQTSINNNVIEFDTAWGWPEPVINAFMQKFKINCTYKSFDEGGWFWFVKEYKDGVLVNERYKENVDYAALAKELKGWETEKAPAEVSDA